MSELYTLPDGWKWKKTIEKFLITDYVANGSFASLRENVEYKDEKDYAILVRLTDYSNGWNGNYKYVTKKSYDFLSKSALKEDDILICNVGATIGTTFKVPELGQPMTLAPNSILIRPLDESTENQYAFYYFKSNIFQTKISNIATTTAQPKFNKTDFRSQYIPLPTLEEQKRIVAKLDNLFAKIDKAIALHQKNIDEANVFMASVLNDVFVELEEKYGLNILSEVVKINSGIALPSIFKDKESMNGEYEFFKVAQMNNDKRVMKGADLNFTLNQSKEFKIKLFPKGSILIPKRGGAILTNKKRIMERDASYDSNIMGLKADNKILSDEFLFVYLDSINLCDFVDTSTIPQINNKHIDMMNISLPPLKTQQKIVSYLDEISNKMEKIKQIQKEKMESLKALKASILDQAFRGEL